MHLNLSLPKYQKMVALQEFNGQWNEIENFGEMIVCCTLQLLLLLMMCLVMHKALQLSSVDKMCTVTTASNWTAWSWQMIQKTTRNFRWRFSSVLQDRFTLSTEICSLFIIWDRCESFLSDNYGLWLNYKCRRMKFGALFRSDFAFCSFQIKMNRIIEKFLTTEHFSVNFCGQKFVAFDVKFHLTIKETPKISFINWIIIFYVLINVLNNSVLINSNLKISLTAFQIDPNECRSKQWEMSPKNYVCYTNTTTCQTSGPLNHFPCALIRVWFTSLLIQLNNIYHFDLNHNSF